MVTKGIITSIDFLSNTCKIRLPLFETAAAHSEAEIDAIFSIQPGQFNGYKVNDVVEVAFEDGNASKPVVIGKLYLGAETETNDARGTTNVETLVVTKKAILPLDTTISFEGNEKNQANVEGGYSSYNKLSDVLDGLQKTTEQLSDTKVQLKTTDENVLAKVSKTNDGVTTGFGWDLQADKWTVFNTEEDPSGQVYKSKDILVADADGLYVNGRLDVREASTIAGFDVGNRAIYSQYTEDGLINEALEELAEDIENATTAEERRNLIDPTTNPVEGMTGVYVGTDGLRIGNAFSVNAEGQVTASGLKIKLTPEQIEQLRFKIVKTYSSITKMCEDWKTAETTKTDPQVKAGEFVSIDAGSSAEETGYVYAKSSTQTPGTGAKDQPGWNFVVDMSGIVGASATAYRIASSTLIHLGNRQTMPISIAAWAKTGNSPEAHDNEVNFKVLGITGIDPSKFITDSSQVLADKIELLSESAGTTIYGIKILLDAIDACAEDIIVQAYHKTGIVWDDSAINFDTETITYSPLNTPVIALTNDNASIAYKGLTKVGENVSTTAKLIYNGAEKTPKSLLWTLTNLTATTDLTTKDLTIATIDNGVKQGYAAITMNWTDPSGRTWSVGPVTFNVTKQLQGEAGAAATSYWTIVDHPIHTGATQSDDIVITAKCKTGTDAEATDTTADIYVDGTKKSADGTGTCTIPAADIKLKTADIKIETKHGSTIIDTEYITYSPLNTPVVDLSNDSAAIAYDGNTKITAADEVASTATLYLNGEELAASYSWALSDCSIKEGTTTTGKTITIYSIANDKDKATATVTATVTATGKFKDKTYTKVFNITKQFKGNKGDDGSTVTTWQEYKLSTSSTDPEAYIGDTWSTNIKVPTKETPYSWVRTGTLVDETTSYNTPTIHETLDTLVSILAADGIDLISRTGSEPGPYEYALKADRLDPATSVNNGVKISGFTVNNSKLWAGQGSGSIALQSNQGDNNFTSAEYILSNGTNYIDTGFAVTSENFGSLKYVLDAMPTPTAQGNQWWANGNGENSDNVFYVGLYWSATSTKEFVYGNGKADILTGVPCDINTRYRFELDIPNKTYKVYDAITNTLICNKTNIAVNTPTSGVPGNIYLCAWHNPTSSATSTPSAIFSQKVYSCKIYQGDRLVRNFVPVLYQSQFGLYDLVNSKFYKDPNNNAFDGAINADVQYSYTDGTNTYQRVEYIQSIDGENTVLNTGYIPNTETTIDIKLAPISSNYLFGCGRNEAGRGGNAFIGAYYNGSGINLEYNGIVLLPYQTPQADGTVTIKTYISNNVYYAYVNNANGSTTKSTSTTSGQFLIGAVADGTSQAPAFRAQCKYYYLKIFENNTLVHNFVPVKNTSNVYGLFDTVTKEFKSGTGDFTGKDLTEISGSTFTAAGHTYRVLRYIESHGQEYINTGIINNVDNYEIETSFIQSKNVNGQVISGSIIDGSSGYSALLQINNNNELNIYQNTTSILSTPIALNEVNNLKASMKNGNLIFTLNGVIQSVTYTFVNNNLAQWLFTCNVSGSASGNIDGLKLYSYKIKQNGILVRNFIPVLQDATTFGLFDIVNGSFYGNQGSGAFTGAGSISEFNSIYLGSEDETDAPFRVTNTGKLFATEATIKGDVYANNGYFNGTVNATAGNIGGCKIQNGTLEIPAANIDGQLVASQINAQGLEVNKLLVKTADDTTTLLDAGHTSNSVKIGGWDVAGTKLYNTAHVALNPTDPTKYYKSDIRLENEQITLKCSPNQLATQPTTSQKSFTAETVLNARFVDSTKFRLKQFKYSNTSSNVLAINNMFFLPGICSGRVDYYSGEGGYIKTTVNTLDKYKSNMIVVGRLQSGDSAALSAGTYTFKLASGASSFCLGSVDKLSVSYVCATYSDQTISIGGWDTVNSIQFNPRIWVDYRQSSSTETYISIQTNGSDVSFMIVCNVPTIL